MENINWAQSADGIASPYIEVADTFQTYYAALNGRTAEEMIASFRLTYDWNCDLDLTPEQIEECEAQDPVSRWEVHE